MLLSTIASVFSALLITQGTLAALTPQQVVDNINIVATLSGDANTALSKLSTNSTSSSATTISQTLVANFQNIINSLTGDVTAMQATPPFVDKVTARSAMQATPASADAVTQPIVDSLRNFVLIHQMLLSTVIGKHSIFAQFALTAPITAVLRSLEGTIDSFAFAMIDLIPGRQADVQTDKDQLDESVGNSITTYEQICIPSPLYPAVPPVCVSSGLNGA